MKKLSRIKSGALSRGFALARMSAEASAKAATHVVGNLFSSADKRPERLKALLMSQVELLARELGQLKGSVMKVGQLLSIYGERFLPEEVNAVLKSLQSQSPPLAWSAVEPVLEKQLGREILDQLEIEPEALASASLGQVHRARIRPGTELARKLPEFASIPLAMKVQYPGVDQSIDSDLATLKRIFLVSKLLPNTAGYEALFEEVRQMLHQEVDYEHELEATVAFRKLLSRESRFIVPRVVPELSSKRLLTTEYLSGVPVDSPEVAALSQERRDALGLAALELLFMELYELHQVQTDPHFGNYRIRLGENGEQDRIVLLDFGAVRKLPKTFLRPYFELHRGAFYRDQALIESAGEGLGFFTAEDTPELKRAFAELVYMLSEPFGHDAYDWRESDLPTRAARAGAEVAFAFKLRPPPREIVFIDRKLGGVFVFLSVLGTRVQSRELLERYLQTTATVA